MTQPPLVITGMHRSGTSLLAEVLVCAGAHLGPPDQWLPPDVSNPHGYFEDRRVVGLNDRLLHLWKGTWDEPPPLPPNWLDDPRLLPLADEGAAWLDSMGNDGAWGWKDPRTSLVLPFWRRLVPDLRCVLCLRDPLEVGRSLAKRDQMSPPKAAFLWLHYLTECLQGLGDRPCAFFFYDELLRNPAAEVLRLLQFSGVHPLSVVDACVGVVDPALRRQRVEQPAAAGEEPLEMCRSVYLHLRSLLADCNNSPSPAAIDEGLRAGRAALRLLAPTPEERRPLLEIRFAELELAQTTIRDLRTAYEHAAALATEKEEEITVAREAIVQRDHRLEESARALAERAVACATLDAEMRVARGTIDDLHVAHDRAAALAKEKEAEITVARQAIVERDHQLEASARALDERVAACATLEAELQVARGTIDVLRVAHDRAAALAKEKEAEIDVARQAIVERDHQLEVSAHALDERVAACARLEADQRELEGRVEHDADTLKEMNAELAAWHERKRALLQSMVARQDGARGFWRRLFVSVGAIRTEAALARSLVGSSRLLANFDQPASNVDEGDVQFTGWCLHPSRGLTGVDLQLNGVSFPTRFGLDRPDVGAVYPDAPGSAHSGFLVSTPLVPGRYLMTLEAQCKDLGPEIYVAPQVLVVRRRPAWKRVAARMGRGGGFLAYAVTKLRRRLAHGRGFPSWREIPGQVRRARKEFARRGNADSSLQPPEGFAPPAPIDTYDAWLADNRWGPRQEADLRARLQAAGDLPRISIVTPVYRPDIRYFLETADSVRGQVYGNWEWCLADDASNDAGLTDTLRALAARDPRVRFVTRTDNGHISAATNSAAQIAQGEFIALMDHDDLLSPDCLAEVALHLAAHDDVDVLYTDDDKIAVDGKRYGPQFKPDWSPESLLSQMYFSHLFVVRRSLYQQVGGMRVGFEGSQDHDLALRVVEKARRVGHLPLILYHWRAVPSSTAASGDAKLYSFDAGIRAVTEALARRGVPAEVDRPDWAVEAKASLLRHRFPDDGPRVAILVATHNQRDMLERCVASLAKTRYRNFEIAILDDASDDPETIAWLDRFPGRVLRMPGPRAGFNFAAIHNHAAREVDAEYLLFLNNDTEVINPAWLSQMVGFARLDGVGAVGARLLFPNDTVQHAGILHGFNQGALALAFRGLPREQPGYLAAARVCRNYGAVTAACMLTPRRLFLELGGFDEQNFAVSFNDADYCYRLVDRGYRCVYAAEAELYHHEGATRGIGSRVDEIARFRQRYGHRAEPYYNPNLSTTSEHFEVRPRRLARRADRPVRALLTCHTLDLTGAPFCQFEMATALRAKDRLDPIVISPEDGPLRSLYEECGIPVRILPHAFDKVASIADYERELAAFAQHVLDADVEVVYGNTLKTHFAIDAAHRLDLPSLWNIRESEPWQTYYSYLPDAVAARALQCFAYPYRVLFVSNASRAVFETLDGRHNFQVIHDGLDLAKWEARLGGWNRATAREKLGVDPDERVAILLGTVCERKGQHDLVKALALLTPEVAGRLRCFIVGDRPGDYSRQLAGLVHHLPAALRRRVHVVPETRDVAVYYLAADLFVCSSRVESYPRVTLEAMACGLPIVSTPVFGLSEQLVDEVNALLYQPGDVAALAKALTRLAGDDALRERMGAQSKVVLAGLKSFEEMAEDYGVQFMEAREAR